MRSLLFALIVLLQGTAPKPSFEVASIRPAAAGARPRQAVEPGGRYVATGLPLQMIISFAYRGVNIEGGAMPSWATTDLWDIQAKAPEGAIPATPRPPTLTEPDPIAPFVQSLLEDRFQLKMHRETKDLPVYELTIAKGGLKIKQSEDQTPPMRPAPGAPSTPGVLPRGATLMGRGLVSGSAIAFPDLVGILSAVLQRKVIDKTGLTGRYDFKLEWTPDETSNTGVGPFARGGPIATQAPPSPDPASVSVFANIEDQLGLKVNSARAMVEVTVIDSVRKPSEN